VLVSILECSLTTRIVVDGFSKVEGLERASTFSRGWSHIEEGDSIGDGGNSVATSHENQSKVNRIRSAAQ
jgi:hypothetical protein